jgi:hypothetical protein
MATAAWITFSLSDSSGKRSVWKVPVHQHSSQQAVKGEKPRLVKPATVRGPAGPFDHTSMPPSSVVSKFDNRPASLQVFVSGLHSRPAFFPRTHDRSRQTRNQTASAGGLMALPRNGRTAIGYSRVAFEDHIGLDVGVQRAFYEIALAGHAPPGITESLGGGDDLAAVVGGVTESDEVDHEDCFHTQLFGEV